MVKQPTDGRWVLIDQYGQLRWMVFAGVGSPMLIAGREEAVSDLATVWRCSVRRTQLFPQEFQSGRI